jgi:hypothetical protein
LIENSVDLLHEHAAEARTPYLVQSGGFSDVRLRLPPDN